MARAKLTNPCESNSRLFAQHGVDRRDARTVKQPAVEDVRQFTPDEQDAMERSSFYSRMMTSNRGVL